VTSSVRMGHLLRMAAVIVIGWIIFALFSSSEFYRRGQASGGEAQKLIYVLQFQLSSALMWAVATPLVIFVAERLPLRKPNRVRNAASLVVFAVVFSVVRAALGGAITQWAEGSRTSLGFMLLSINVRFHRNVFLIFMIILIVNLVLAQRDAAAREQAGLALKAAVAKAELQQFRSSVQPRFVLGTLDAIGESIPRDPGVADRMLVDLADLLRAKLDFQNRREVTLLEELELIDRYVEIEKTRNVGFHSRVDVDEELLSARIPPLLLHPLVESAIVGADDSPSGRLEITGRADAGVLLLEVGNLDRSTPGRDAAVAETRERLRQSFDGRTSLELTSIRGALVARLAMPFQTAVTGGES
jgi:two-component system, LytTR family, sensor kinase